MSSAIVCDGIWKSYRIYQHRAHSMKERIVSRRNRYEEFWALQDISFKVPAGTTLGIIGSNGSGKSTLLKVMARILTPNKGTVVTQGRMSSLLELGTGFHPELTGNENVYLAGALLGESEAEMSARYDEIVAFAGIAEFMDVPVKNYSSGMYARLAFAVAISIEPDILLLDEVLAVGDESFQMKCHERIAEFHTQGRTIVLVSHNLEAIRSLCTQALWVDNGKLRAQGEAQEVVAEYLQNVHQADEAPMPLPGDRFGSGEAVVDDVTFLDGAGGTGGQFRTGEPMTIRIRFTAKEPIDDVACQLHIFRGEEHQHVYGHSTRDAGMSFTLGGEGTVEFKLDELPLLAGSYTLTVALQDRTGRRVYDHLERRFSFMVFENPSLPFEAGTVHMKGTWSVSPDESVVAPASSLIPRSVASGE